jgi:hypothetical protein
MKRFIYSALVATVAISGALASQAKEAKKVFTRYVESTPTSCSSIDCAPLNPGVACSTLSLFTDDACQVPATNVEGFKLDI